MKPLYTWSLLYQLFVAGLYIKYIYIAYTNLFYDRPDDGGSKHVLKRRQTFTHYSAQQTRRQPSLYSPPSEPEILCYVTLSAL
jgi:hypothetical protein